MSTSPSLVAFSGSTREESFNKKLVRLAAQAAERAGAKVTLIDLRDFPLPLYDGDLERKQGIPENANKLRAQLAAADGMLIASPEYNSSVSAVLKNTIDWVSRPTETEPALVAFAGKVVGIMSASPGNLGGLRGLVQLRSILGNINMLVIPEQLAVSRAHEAFSESGDLLDSKTKATLDQIAARAVSLAAAIAKR